MQNQPINTAKTYLILMCLSAVLLTLLLKFYPQIKDLGVPLFLFLLAPSLIFELYAMPKIADGKWESLNGNQRAIGFVCGALLFLGLNAFLTK